MVNRYTGSFRGTMPKTLFLHAGAALHVAAGKASGRLHVVLSAGDHRPADAELCVHSFCGQSARLCLGGMQLSGRSLFPRMRRQL